jgi:hypothetical protein
LWDQIKDTNFTLNLIPAYELQIFWSLSRKESLHNGNICSLMFIVALFTIAKFWKQPDGPTTGWMDQENVVYIHNEVLLSHRNNDMWIEGKWMQLEDNVLSEVSQAQKDKGCMFAVICGKQIQKINIYTKPNMIINKLRCRTCL